MIPSQNIEHLSRPSAPAVQQAELHQRASLCRYRVVPGLASVLHHSTGIVISTSDPGGVLHDFIQLHESRVGVKLEAAHKSQHEDVHAEFFSSCYTMVHKDGRVAVALVVWMYGDVVENCSGISGLAK